MKNIKNNPHFCGLKNSEIKSRIEQDGYNKYRAQVQMF